MLCAEKLLAFGEFCDDLLPGGNLYMFYFFMDFLNFILYNEKIEECRNLGND